MTTKSETLWCPYCAGKLNRLRRRDSPLYEEGVVNLRCSGCATLWCVREGCDVRAEMEAQSRSVSMRRLGEL